MYSGRGGSRNDRIGSEMGGAGARTKLFVFRPLLTFYRVFHLTIPRELNFPRRVGESKFFRRCWVGVVARCGGSNTYS